MTTKVNVSVNGKYKIPVKQGDVVTWVSGRGDDPATKSKDFWPHSHGDGTVFTIGPEEPDTDDMHVGDDVVLGVGGMGGTLEDPDNTAAGQG